MPNLSALLAARPDWRAAITLDDGRIASLPLLNTTERQVCVWINAVAFRAEPVRADLRGGIDRRAAAPTM